MRQHSNYNKMANDAILLKGETGTDPNRKSRICEVSSSDGRGDGSAGMKLWRRIDRRDDMEARQQALPGLPLAGEAAAASPL
jgi:hypothetical protein